MATPSERYRMQFILGPRIPAGFSDWQQLGVGETFHLIAHSDLNVEQVERDPVSITVIGYLLDPRHPHASNADILDKLITSIEQGGDLFEIVAPLGGRWVLLVNDRQSTRLLGDATGLRQVFYADKRQTGELWCASQPGHIAKALNLEMDPDALDFIEWFQSQSPESWWPGDSSPYREVRRLLPNRYLELQTGEVHRFWPRESFPGRSLDDAVGGIAETLTGMMQSAANRFDLAVAMSAGWDSRLMLAACQPIARELSYYTARRPDMAWTHMDVRIPERLLVKLELPHDIIEHGTEVTPEFAGVFNSNMPFAHPTRLAPLQSELNYYGRKKVGVTGNVSEVVRCYYRRPEPTQTITAEYLMTATGMEHPFARKYFAAWLDDAGDPHGYNMLDLFYWEQRTGSWFAHNCLEFDAAWQEIFIPFNNRQLLVDMLAVDEDLRKAPDFELYRQLMLALWPEVLCEPINPTAKRKGIRRYLRAIARRVRRLVRR
ncbi:MAG TPA: hypothetical protein ENI68_08495 [Gammaproteobacteria bacterium]|nr:hypothetical protein [Gammaproteobacteria bacterium]